MAKAESNRKLEQKFIHIPSGETVVVCTGVVLLDNHSDFKQSHRSSWKFLQPIEGPGKESLVIKKSTNQKSLNELRDIIWSLGYDVPESYGLILNTDLTNITVKKTKIFVRVNSSTSEPLSFSFQYQSDSLTSYHNAIENALSLRDHLVEARVERSALVKRVNEANRILKVINGHKSIL